MKKVFLPGMLLFFVLFLGACGASIKMMNSWMNDSKAGYSIKNVLVVGISPKDITRNLWENTFVELLGKEHIQAKANHIILNGQVIEPNRQSISEAVKKAGADTVLITRVIGRDIKTKTTSGFASYQTSPYYTGIYDYYGFAFREVYTPSVSERETTVLLESNIYDVASEKLIWTAQIQCTDVQLLKTDFDKMVNMFVDDLKKKKLI